MKKVFLLLIVLCAASAMFAQDASDLLVQTRNETNDVKAGYMKYNWFLGKMTINDNIIEKQNYYRYFDSDDQELITKGNSLVDLGGKFIGGGVGFALGWGLSSMIFPSNNENSGIDNNVIYAICAGVAAIGIPITIAGNKKVQTAVQHYNTKNGYVHFSPELNFLVNPDGFGLALRF